MAEMAHDTKNFHVMEFACRCKRFECAHVWVDQRLVDGLQRMRDIAGYPIYINSGCRCDFQNKRVGGVRNSTHLRGAAADIRCEELTPLELKKIAEMVPVFRNGGVGLYDSWLHVDVRGTRARWRG